MAEILQEPVTAGKPDISGIIADGEIPADNQAETGLKILKPADYAAPADRPGWIPPEITHGWDTDPYAYQTEEEMMPAGGPHGELLTYLGEILRDFFRRKGIRYLADTFMLYRDSQGIRQRVAPDLLVMPFRSPAPSSYNLDSELPPQAVTEITSPESRSGDMGDKVSLYTGLGIPAYLVIDMFTPDGELRGQAELHLWRRTEARVRKIQADAEGYLSVPEMGIKIKARGENLIFADIVTGEILYDNSQLRQKAEQEAELRKQETTRAEKERQRAEKEAELRKQEAELRKQEAELRKQETARAEQEAELRKQEAARAEKEAELRKQETARAEQERQRAEQLEAKLRELGISLTR